MAGHSITVSGTISAPRERVWRVLTDLDNAPTLIPSITSVERLTDGPYAAGTRWRETRTMLGRTETHELEVAERQRNLNAPSSPHSPAVCTTPRRCTSIPIRWAPN